MLIFSVSSVADLVSELTKSAKRKKGGAPGLRITK